MDYESVRAQALMLLQQEKRLSYRALKLRLQLDEDALEALKEDLIYAKHLAVDEDGRVLVWTGDAGPVTASGTGAPPPVAPPDPPGGDDLQVGSSPSELRPREAERRQLTVLFCDLVGSTVLASQLDPEEWREVVRAYQDICAKVIGRFEGRIAQYLGDGLLVYFGYPQAHEDDAQRAVRAGLGMVEAVSQLNTRLAHERGVFLAVRLGIHTGQVVVGEIGSGVKHEQLALGETPNVAARLQGIAVPNTVVISAATFQLLGGFFACQSLGTPTLKGVSQSLEVYQVLSESMARSRLEAAGGAGLTPLVGREQEVALLRERWAQVKEGMGQVVLLSGEAGIGKSRLVQVLTSHVAAEPQTWLTPCQCSPYHQHTALYPMIDLLERVVLRFEREESPPQKLYKLEGFVVQYGLPLAETVPLFAALLSLPLAEGYTPLTVSPEQQKQKTLHALLTILLRIAAQRPVLFVMEDLHWVDPSTLEFLTLLVDQGPTARILALFTCRPDFSPPWTGRAHLTQTTLNRLPRRQAAELTGRVAHGKALPPEVVGQIVAKTDGVPLFVEELTKMLLESGLLQERAEHYELTGPLPPLAIPATLHDSLMARLDRLAAAKALAQLGATLGREFAYELLQAVSLWDEDTLQQGLHLLVTAEFLYQQGVPPQATYRFKHALIQDAAYQSLLRSTRQQSHQRIAQVLEARFPAVAETEPEVLARHYTEAGLPAQAFPYWQRAGERAMARSALREAVVCLEQALRALPHLPESRETLAQGIDLRLALRNALMPLGAFDHLFARLREAETLATALNDPRRSGWVHTHMTHYFWMTRHLDQALVSGQRALALATPLDDFELYAAANFCLAEVYYSLGDYPQAIAALRWNVEAITGDRMHKVFGAPAIYSVVSRRWLVTALAEVGAFAEGLARGEEAIRIAEAAEHPYSLVNAYLGLSYVAVRRGDFPQAIPLLTRALELCHVWDLAQLVPICAVALGQALALAGRSAEGLTLVQQTVPQAAPQSFIGRNTPRVIQLSETYLSAGRLEEATVLARQALDLACEQQARGDQAYARHLLGEIAARRDPPEAEPAEAHDRQALALAGELGMRPLQGHCHRGLGTLYAKIGRREQARTELSMAIELYRAMDLTFWLPQAEAALAQAEGC